MNLRQLDKKYFGRRGEPEDVVVGNSADSYLTDARGRKYIDFVSGGASATWVGETLRSAPRRRSSMASITSIPTTSTARGSS